MVAGGLWTCILAIMFSSSSTFTCAFKVNCSSVDQLAATGSFINHFLFYYEKVGGDWHGVVDTTEFPFSFKIGLFFIFLSMSIVHHAGYKFIVTGPFVTKTLRQRLGWVDGSCSCRKRRLKTQKIQHELSMREEKASVGSNETY